MKIKKMPPPNIFCSLEANRKLLASEPISIEQFNLDLQNNNIKCPLCNNIIFNNYLPLSKKSKEEYKIINNDIRNIFLKYWSYRISNIDNCKKYTEETYTKEAKSYLIMVESIEHIIRKVLDKPLHFHLINYGISYDEYKLYI